MRIEEIKTGILVFISSIIEEEIDGIKRRKGALGMVDSPVLGTGGLWWWVMHEDGMQIKYRYCEISEMKTIKVPNKVPKSEVLEDGNELKERPGLDSAINGRGETLFDKKNGEGDLAQEWMYEVIEKWIN